jgi:hypothetical protein
MATSMERDDLICPSAPENAEGARVIGIVMGSADRPRVEALREPLPITDELLQLTIAGKCAEHRCKHFVERSCSLATRIVSLLPEVVEKLPVCAVRDQCRWFDQEKEAACRRCPQIVRDMWQYTEVMARAANPDSPAQGEPVRSEGNP